MKIEIDLKDGIKCGQCGNLYLSCSVINTGPFGRTTICYDCLVNTEQELVGVGFIQKIKVTKSKSKKEKK